MATFDEIKKAFPNIEHIEIKPPSWGYCVMKRLNRLDDRKDLPQFATVEEHGRGNPVTLRTHQGDKITDLEYQEFNDLYQID